MLTESREFGFMGTRIRLRARWLWALEGRGSPGCVWMRAAAAWQHAALKVARFGDNMREVAVTEGDKVEAQMRLRVLGEQLGIGDLVDRVKADLGCADREAHVRFDQRYTVAKELKPGGTGGRRRRASSWECATFGGRRLPCVLNELPGCTAFHSSPASVQRLMADGYGFGEKTAALVRAMKVMASASSGGTSFMEDYTYHFDPSGMKVLGPICGARIDIRRQAVPGDAPPVHRRKEKDPARLVFTARSGSAVNATVIDDSSAWIVEDVVPPLEPLPTFPRSQGAVDTSAEPEIAAAAWILAGSTTRGSATR